MGWWIAIAMSPWTPVIAVIVGTIAANLALTRAMEEQKRRRRENPYER